MEKIIGFGCLIAAKICATLINNKLFSVKKVAQEILLPGLYITLNVNAEVCKINQKFNELAKVKKILQSAGVCGVIARGKTYGST